MCYICFYMPELNREADINEVSLFRILSIYTPSEISVGFKDFLKIYFVLYYSYIWQKMGTSQLFSFTLVFEILMIIKKNNFENLSTYIFGAHHQPQMNKTSSN